jgi:hypothetical protein
MLGFRVIGSQVGLHLERVVAGADIQQAEDVALADWLSL